MQRVILCALGVGGFLALATVQSFTSLSSSSGLKGLQDYVFWIIIVHASHFPRISGEVSGPG